MGPVVEIDTGDSNVSATAVVADDSTESDIPFLETASGEAVLDTVDSYEEQTSSAVNDFPGASPEDLPVLDTEAIENAIEKETQAVTDGSDGEGPDTDGS